MKITQKLNLQEYILDNTCEINSSNHTPYAFTLRRVLSPENSTLGDYFRKINKWRAKGVVLQRHVCEHNVVNTGFHIHGIFLVPKKFNMKQFRIRGYHTYLDELYDKSGWDAYMSKEQILDQSGYGLSDERENSPLPKPKECPRRGVAESPRLTEDQLCDECIEECQIKIPKYRLF